MPTVSRIIKIRQSRNKRERLFPWGDVGLGTALCISLLMVVIIIIGAWFYLDLIRGQPTIYDLPRLLEPPDGSMLQPTRFYDRAGQHVIVSLENPAAMGWKYLKVSEKGLAGKYQAPQHLIDAILSELDPGFWQEPGYTLSGITEGIHSTLAQRLVLSLLLENEPASLKRNIQERVLAMQVTAQFGREKVLEWYLNSAQYGGFVYGADAAARVYFGKPATQLSIAEAAMLAALAELPGRTPWRDQQIIRDQLVQVILRMQAQRLINNDEALDAVKENIQIKPEQHNISLAPAMTAQALHQLNSRLPADQLYRGGYKVITTLDYALQLQVACTAQAQINHLQGTAQQVTTDDGTPCQAALDLPVNPADSQNPDERLSAEAIILDPQSGEILAWVSEYRENLSQSILPAHPAASILSPFMYLTAFSRGMSPATLLWDVPGESDPILSQDQLASFHGPVRLRKAMVNDYAGAAEQVLQQVGLENVVASETKFGINVGITSSASGLELSELYSQAVPLLDVVQAYAVLANQGVKAGQSSDIADPGQVNPNTVLRVEGLDGRALLDWSGAKLQPVVTSQLAYLTTNVLSDENARTNEVVNPHLLEIGRPAAIKVGMTREGTGAWTVGYIPELTVGVWMGKSQGPGGHSAEMAAGLWRAIMLYASSQLPVQEFTAPDGISWVQVCEPSGMLVSTACPSVVEELFVKGSEPTQIDNLFHEFFIDRQTGLLATIFTPADLVEKKVFMRMPSGMAKWAEAAGIPSPPEMYDKIILPSQTSAQVQIANPLMLDYVSGQVELQGSAMADDFSYYRLLVGQGLNPQQWLQIGEDIHQPVQNTTLGTWDTTDLEGLYVVELMVIHQDLGVERAVLLLEVDNTPPHVQILTPQENDQISSVSGKTVVLQAEASDNQVLMRVEFYLDGNLVSTLDHPPFLALWQAKDGMHTLVVKAYDQAGNQNMAQISFEVVK